MTAPPIITVDDDEDSVQILPTPVVAFQLLTNYGIMISTMLSIDIEDGVLSATQKRVLDPAPDDLFTLDEIVDFMDTLRLAGYERFLTMDFVYVVYNVRVIGAQYNNHASQAVGIQLAMNPGVYKAFYIEW
jgi:hypothetical protein